MTAAMADGRPALLSRVRDRALAVPPPAVVLGVMVALYSIVFGHLTWRQHSHWNSLGFDTGIYDQGIWLLSRGVDPFMTMRGIDYWGHHVSLIGMPFAVLYRLGAGVHELTLIHTIWVGSGAIPLWLIAKDRLGKPWPALAVPFAWLLHPAVHWVTWWLYHPDSFAITPLLFAWWFGRNRRWGWFAASAGVAVSCKEDVALAVAAMGVAFFFIHRDDRMPAVAMTFLGIGWFLLCTKVMIPWRNGEGSSAFYESYFPTLGSGLGDIAYNSIRHPSRVIELLGRPRNWDYTVQMLGPAGFVMPLLSPLALLVAGPQLGVNLLVEVQNGATIKSQYASMPLAGIFLAVAETFGLLRILRAWWIGAVGLVVCALIGTHLWGLGPLGQDQGEWGKQPRPNIATLKAGKALVPGDAPLSASWNVVTQFTHRRTVFEFPNPWMSSNYGLSGNEVDEPNKVDWIFVELGALGEKEQALLDRLTAPTGDFRVLLQRDEVVVARRWRPDTVGHP